ncbi:MAG: response regulator transcription factor [Bacillota bacterium]
MSRKKVLVVDDDINIRRLVEAALKQNGFEVTHVDSGEKALAALSISPFDVIILDILLPGIDGLETLKQIRANPCFRQLPVIMLTSKNSEIDNVVGLELGADDYVGKPIRYYELVARVKSVLRRAEKTARTDTTIIHVGELEIDLDSRTACYQGNPLSLSHKEFKLLALLAKIPGKVFTREEILNAIWQDEYTYETRTVDVHIRRLRSKFEKTGNGNGILIDTIRNVGYRLTSSF